MKGQAFGRILRSSTSASRKVNIVNSMKRKNELTQKSERDSMVFAGTTVGTLLKNHGERQLSNYANLSFMEKHVVGMCLNSVIDLSNESQDSQRRFFTASQWKEMKKKYSVKSKHHKVPYYQEKLKGINKLLRSLDIDDGYKKARSLESEHLNSEDESLYGIYAHVINIFRKRKIALQNSNKSNTELDCLVKFWSEIIESLFPDNKDHIYCKWEESKTSFN